MKYESSAIKKSPTFVVRNQGSIEDKVEVGLTLSPVNLACIEFCLKKEFPQIQNETIQIFQEISSKSVILMKLIHCKY